MRLISTLMSIASAALAKHMTTGEKKVLTIDGARMGIAGAAAEAKKHHARGVVAVVDDGGRI